MLCGVITGPSLKEIQNQITKASLSADILELRWDCFESLDFVIHCTLPMIFTLRPLSQGGHYLKDEESRLQELERLMQAKPGYVDLEYTIPIDSIKELQKKFPEVKIILSYHNFDYTPDDLSGVLASLKQKPADLYKIATMANSTIDALRMLNFTKKTGAKVIGLCMGECGVITRILNHFTYASIDNQYASKLSQLSLDTLTLDYRYKSLNSETDIYGLIGNPVDKSPSHTTHNKVFEFYNLNAVYIKMNIQPQELWAFFKEIKSLNFKGLSVTMPLKEAVMPYLDELDSKAHSISAVNTIVFKHKKLIGHNTDCTGALLAIEEKTAVKSKNILIIGAGGSAKAIAFELLLRGANVTILNRNIEKAMSLASVLNCAGGSLDDIKTHYDILINCTPDEMPINTSYVIEGSYVMDIKIHPTVLQNIAQGKNCSIIFGYDMFVYQAIEQFKLWLKKPIEVNKIKALLLKPLNTYWNCQ